MQTNGYIAQRAYRLLTAVGLAVLAGLCPWHRTWRYYGVRTGRSSPTAKKPTMKSQGTLPQRNQSRER